MTVHILTLTWQGKDKLEKLYPSLLPAIDGLNVVWHIKDNGSSDGSVEEIQNWNDPKINLVKYPNNKQSYSQGMNLLFEQAQPKNDDVVITLNNDVIIRNASSIKDMIRILADDNDIGVVGAKLNYTNTSTIQHAGVLFSPSNGFPFHFRAGCAQEERDCLNRYYPIVTGAVSALRADTFANCFANKSGSRGFCENYFFAFEDVDMCLRVEHHLKKRNVYCGTTEIWHEESASLKKNPVHKLFLSANCKAFGEAWSKYVDVRLVDQYANPQHNLYRGGK